MREKAWIMFAAQYMGGGYGLGVALTDGINKGRQSISGFRDLEDLLDRYGDRIIEGAVVVDGRVGDVDFPRPDVECMHGMEFVGYGPWSDTGPLDRAVWDIWQGCRVGLWSKGTVAWVDEAASQLSEKEALRVVDPELSGLRVAGGRWPKGWIEVATLVRLEKEGLLSEAMAERILTESTSIYIRRAAVARGLGVRIAAEIFRDASRDPVIRQMLVQRHGKDDPALLEMAVADLDLYVAGEALDLAATSGQVSLLERMAKTHPEPLVRGLAVNELGRLGGSEDLLREIALKDGSAYVRGRAVRGLTEHASLEAVLAVETDAWVLHDVWRRRMDLPESKQPQYSDLVPRMG
jgi:hypothetical protein